MDGFRSVVCHPYRTARVEEIFLRLPREFMGSLEQELARAAGVGMDNHTVYTIDFGFTQMGGHQIIHVLFTDHAVIFGHDIQIKNW